MADIAVGTVIFSRTSKLKNLLQSIENTSLEEVYVADNGHMTSEKEKIYEKSYKFNLHIIDVEYDSGLAYSRNRLVEEINQDFLFLVDNDMQIFPNIDILRQQLEADESIGGICGMLIENDQIKANCNDIFVENNTCKKDIRSQKPVEIITGHPFIEFDQIANAGLFRTECLSEYPWDPRFKIGYEHLDLSLRHKQESDWRFGVCPSVSIRHDISIDDDYSQFRDRTQKSRKKFIDKWGFDNIEVVHASGVGYINTYNTFFKSYPPHSNIRKAWYYFQREGIRSLIQRTLRHI